MVATLVLLSVVGLALISEKEDFTASEWYQKSYEDRCLEWYSADGATRDYLRTKGINGPDLEDWR